MDMAYSEGGESDDHTDFVGHYRTMGIWRLIKASFIFCTETSGEGFKVIGRGSVFIGVKKRSLTRLETKLSSEKESGIELLSRSQLCSTIVAGPLIDRVRDGNVSCKPAIDTGKKVKDAGCREVF